MIIMIPLRHRVNRYITTCSGIKVCLRILVYVFMGICIWVFCQGQSQEFILKDGYRLWGWPGSLVYINPKTGIIKSLNVSEVKLFEVTEHWIVGLARDGWFAIEMDTSRVWYPYVSEQNLLAASGAYYPKKRIERQFPFRRLVIRKVTVLGLVIFLIAVIIYELLKWRWWQQRLSMLEAPSGSKNEYTLTEKGSS